MKAEAIFRSARGFSRAFRLPSVALVAATLSMACAAGPDPAPAPAPGQPDRTATEPAGDPRVGLAGGWRDAESAISNMELLASLDRPEGFYDPNDLGNILLANSDMAYQGNHLFLGSFHGFQIYDIADPANPRLITAVTCPGGQGDVSVYGDLLFMSVEMPNARVDCGTGGSMRAGADPERFLGVRIFDISDISTPRQVGGVQTCRGSHTHTLVPDESDPEHVYVYVSGTSPVRPAADLEGCTALEPEEDPNTSYFRIEVVRVPLDAPEDATIVNEPRIFAAEGDVAGLWPGGAHGPGTQTTARTDQCHDITAYPAIGLAAGACSGNGILLDITDPANPERIDEVTDPNFAYWHSATFSNEGDKVIFTDEWGGGVAARCQATDPAEWGANAIFRLAGGDLDQAGYYKLSPPQTAEENCVAHNGSLVPVPGRDIMVQAWYQGGISVFDFTDPENPVELAYFDRGPVDPDELLLGGFWSAYWYNGAIYGSEIGRGLDVFRLTPSEHLTQNEIDAARLVRYEEFNPQTQPRVTWPAEFVVARAYLDQLRRSGAIAGEIDRIAGDLDRAEGLSDPGARRTALTELAGMASRLEARASEADARRLDALAQTLRDLARGGPESAAIDGVFAEYDRPGSPGCALSVVRDGEIVYENGYGTANLDWGTPITPSTVFYAGSVSKQFTAAAVALLAREGEISLDDDLRQYFPELPDYGSHITIRNVIHHTSGIGDTYRLMREAGVPVANRFSDSQAVELIVAQESLDFEPGTEYRYSNGGYFLLAELVERVSGTSFREFMETRFFGPLGMEDSHFHDRPDHIVPRRAMSYAPGEGGGFRQTYMSNFDKVGAGGLYTTVRDLARWDAEFYQEQIGGSGFTDLLLTRGELASGEVLPYAFALRHGEHRGEPTVGHSGSMMGFRAYLMRLPEQRLTVATLCNLDSIRPGELSGQVADLFLADAAPALTQVRGR